MLVIRGEASGVREQGARTVRGVCVRGQDEQQQPGGSPSTDLNVTRPEMCLLALVSPILLAPVVRSNHGPLYGSNSSEISTRPLLSCSWVPASSNRPLGCTSTFYKNRSCSFLFLVVGWHGWMVCNKLNAGHITGYKLSSFSGDQLGWGGGRGCPVSEELRQPCVLSRLQHALGHPWRSFLGPAVC